MSQFKSKYTREEQEQCIQEYLAGTSKADLSKKWKTTVRNIDRWINKICSVEQKEALKRKNGVPQDKENEIIDILNQNAILHGFNISKWNPGTVKKLLENKFNIEINKYKARQLLEHANKFNDKIEDREIEELGKLEDLNYDIVLLDFIKIGKMKRNDAKAIYYERFHGDILNIYLGIARVPKCAYISVMYSDLDTINYGFDSRKIFNKPDPNKLKLIHDDKIAFINKVIEKEGDINKVVFVSREDMFMQRFKKSKKKPLFYILNNNQEEELMQDTYEFGEENSLLRSIKGDNKEIVFSSNGEILKVINDRIESYNKNSEIVSILNNY